jgi:hypothetical protein
VDPATYNQVFTMHGTVMMFLFAVPAVEAVAITLLPAMLGTRELPFPRLGAYAFLIYAMGGLLFYARSSSGGAGRRLVHVPPLTSKENSPGINTDMYLLGIGFIEISAIAGAIELIVGILRCRAPGMTLGAHADLRLGHAGLRGHGGLRLPRRHRRLHHPGAGARLQLALLPAGARRRPAALAAPFLVLRPPGGLRHLPALPPAWSR